MYSTLTKQQIIFLLSIMRDNDKLTYDMDGLLWIEGDGVSIHCYKLGELYPDVFPNWAL